MVTTQFRQHGILWLIGFFTLELEYSFAAYQRTTLVSES